ncbi:MAG TPA: DUF4199 domain-containing protein [Candidatus Elarobacter sp.]
MLRKVLAYGTVAGLIVGVPLSAMTIAMKGLAPSPYGLVVGYSTMLIALSTVFVAIKRRRDVDLGGVIAFWPAFGLGLGISFVAGIFYVVAWESAVAATHADFAGTYAKALIEQQKAKGVTGEALAKFIAGMEHFKEQYRNPLYRVPMTFAEIFPVGVLVSLVSAGLLRNSRFLPARRS